MKSVFPRLEAISPRYRFVWHGRFFGFRLTSTASGLPYDGRVSYAAFGSWEQGGVDLVDSHYFMPAIEWSDGRAVRLSGGALSQAGDSFRADYRYEPNDVLRFYLQFTAKAVHLFFEPLGDAGPGPLVLRLPANFVFDKTAHNAFYSSSLATGLRVSSSVPDGVTVAPGSILCRIPTNGRSAWSLSVLDAADWSSAAAPAPAFPETSGYERVLTAGLDAWETAALASRGWKPETGKVRERIAGVFICAEDWKYPTGPLPESRIGYVSKSFLPQLARTRAFSAVGFSRDGITERGRNADWLGLVAQAHHAGFRVYMKPGDGELTRVLEAGGLERWARDVFAVPAEQQCDAVRLPAEALLAPWVTANLCLHPRFHAPELKQLAGLAWPEVSARIVTSVADRFSRVIEAIRRHAPRIAIDVESADTAVLSRLLALPWTHK